MVCATSSVTTPVTLGTAVGRALCIICGTKEASMPAEVLATMERSRWAVIELLLTWLEVEARHGPRNFCHHPRQEKPWCAQLLLDFPSATKKLDEWRATIRSLFGIANKDEP